MATQPRRAKKARRLRALPFVLFVLVRGASAEDYERTTAVLTKYCVGCHNPDDAKGGLDLSSEDGIRKGGENGPVVVPRAADQSKLILLVERKKKPFMPPGKRPRPKPAELAALRGWIDAGALGSGGKPVATLETPRIEPTVPPRSAIHSVAYSPRGTVVATGMHRIVRLVSTVSRNPIRDFDGHAGSVNALAFSIDGGQLVAASGEPGLFGEALLWKVDSGEVVRSFRGHRDTLYAVALSSDGRLLATGSYDQTIALWDVGTGDRIHLLEGHNGAVFGLSFRPDGKVLASASADRTIKLWSVDTGDRLDTFAQATKEQHAVTFSPNGQRVVAGGVDNRIRVWSISATGAEGSNPLLYSRFAHEGAILALAYSSDGDTLVSTARDRTAKVWDAADVKERAVLGLQPDWPVGVAVSPDGRRISVGRLDGTLGIYDAATGYEIRLAARPVNRGVFISLPVDDEKDEDGEKGEEKKPPPKPEVAGATPRGVERGVPTRLRLFGLHLDRLTEVKFHHEKLTGKLLDEASESADIAWLEVVAHADLDPGGYDLSVVSSAGESARLTLFVDTLPQVLESEPNNLRSQANVLNLPTNVWGDIGTSGDVDLFAFEGNAGETLVFDVVANRFGSPANLVLSILDAGGRALNTTNDFDDDPDPLTAFDVPEDGRFIVRVRDLELGGGGGNFYRLTAGRLPFVTDCYPLAVAADGESDIYLTGINLPVDAIVRVRAGDSGEVAVPIAHTLARRRRDFRVAISQSKIVEEREPNDWPFNATAVVAPCTVNGRISDARGPTKLDVDLFRFTAAKGSRWIIETEADRRGSPVDTKIVVLDDAGQPVEQLLLQAVRDSDITFRPVNERENGFRLTNWEEMELNEFVYFGGEVTKIVRMPRGPDSTVGMYTSFGGSRRCYFETSPIAHALNEVCYIVEPHSPGVELVPTGLPIFTLYYANDDGSERDIGTDSRVAFTAPADGDYLVRVEDARGVSSVRFVYRLIVREPALDFVPSIEERDLTIDAGSGKRFSFRVNRRDGFDGAVRFDIAGLPPGFSASTPIVIQAGHDRAQGTLTAATDAPKPSEEQSSASTVTATAIVSGEKVVKQVGSLGKLQLGDEPKLFVGVLPISGAAGTPEAPAEIEIVPGTRSKALLRIARNGHDDLVSFDVDNLPHGVIVDDIGLNGVLIPAEANERQIFLKCAAWVPETSRLFFARSRQAGGQTSLPVMLHVRSPRQK